MSVIRWLVVQEVCSRFKFARHFESHLARPPPFYMRMQTPTSVEHSITIIMLHSTRIIFSTYSFKSERHAISSIGFRVHARVRKITSYIMFIHEFICRI